VLLLWIYYSAQILFFGAELTQVYATRYGSWKGAEERQRQKQGQTTGVVQPRRAAAGPV
jgi:membrane protein